MVRFGPGSGSQNVEDRRGSRGPGRMAMGGGGSMILMLVIVYFVSGGDLGQVLRFFLANNAGIQQGPAGPADPQVIAEQEPLKEFVTNVLGDTEQVWDKLFQEAGRRYEKPRLVLFSDRVQSACGIAGAASGPFYCPGDHQLYIDLTFYDELRDKFGAGGDFAQAYVIAHEVGHHVQNLLGTMDRVQAQRGRLSQSEYNELSVRLELQADFLAGVWAHHAQLDRKILEKGDIEEGLRAASAIGDDTLQKKSQGYVVPDAFTHGTSQQRMKWFRKGLDTGDMSQGDTFSARDL